MASTRKRALRAGAGAAIDAEAIRDEARALGVVGWVRPTGEMHAEGAPDAVAAAVALLGDGATVERARVEGHEQFAIRGVSAGVFVVQEHQATAHHFDVRLEVDGVMRSWAVPKGPSLDPAAKRLAVEVEDHGLEHNEFEGPTGAGGVIVWDRGSYEQGGRVAWPDALERGHAVFVLHGEKLRGGFALQRTRPGAKPQWLLIKRRDDEARRGLGHRRRAARVGCQRPHAGRVAALRHSERVRYEAERVDFHAQGVVTTGDGRQIALDLRVGMQREHHERVSLDIGAPKAKDPLVLNFESATTALGGRRISFDLNLDGKADSVATPSAGTRASARSTSARPARRSRSAAATRRPRGLGGPRACGWPRAGRHTRSSRWTSSSSYPGAVMARVTVQIPTYQRTQWLAGHDRERARTRRSPTSWSRSTTTRRRAMRSRGWSRQFDDPRVTLIRHEKNAGIVGNFTRSLLGAETEYVIQLGDDDEAHPQLVESDGRGARRASERRCRARALRAHRRRRARRWSPSRTVLGTPPQPLEPGADFVASRWSTAAAIYSSTAMIRRSAVPEGGVLAGRLPGRSTSAFWLRMAEALGRRLHRRAAVPLPDPRAEPHVGAWASSPSTGYLHAEQMMRDVHEVKIRHMATPCRASARDELERLADRTLRRDIVGRVRERTLPDRPLKATVRGLGRAARREPVAAARADRVGAAGRQRARAARGRAAKGSCVGRRTPRRTRRRSPPRGSSPARCTDSSERMCGDGRSIVL